MAKTGKFEHPQEELRRLKQGENLFWGSNGQGNPGSVSDLYILPDFLYNKCKNFIINQKFHHNFHESS